MRIRVVACACVVALVVVGACTETRRSNGEDCLKGDDCISGVCSGLKCVATPPILDGSAGTADASRDATGFDAGDASTDAGIDASGDAELDAPVEAAGDAAPDDAGLDAADGS